MGKMETASKLPGKELLQLAAAFGLLTGVIEGIGLFTFHQAQWLNWRLYNRAIWVETLWVAPLFDFALFLLVGTFLALAGFAFNKVLIKKTSWFLFIFLCLFDWLLVILYGRLSLVALFLLAGGISIQLTNYAARFEGSLLKRARSLLPWLAGVTVVIFVAVQGGQWLGEKSKTANLPDASTDAPNVIVIVVDTLRADHLSAYGYDRDTSPFLDSLAKEGLLFQNAISASSWTQPSHASMLTGRYTYEHQAETKPLDRTYPTIGEALQAKGYRTGAFSANTLFFTRRQGFGRGFLHFEDNYQSTADLGFNSLYGFLFDHYGLRNMLNYRGAPGRRVASDINQSALDWVDNDRERPFFLFLNYFDVHDPYLPPEPYRSRYSNVENAGGLINGFAEEFSPSLTPEQLQSEIDAYDGAINYVDDEIKKLFAHLDERSMLKNTVVIITSDHGELLGEHGLLQHSASLYMQEIHVPLIVWGPGYVPADKVINTPVTTSALPATILSLIGSQQDVFPGPPLSQLIFDQVVGEWPNPISEVAKFEGAAEINPSTHGEMKSVVTGEWHFIEHEVFGVELYDRLSDPQETQDLANEAENLSVIELLQKYLYETVQWIKDK